MYIGFDDTDSPRMGCTTYIAAILVEELHKLGASFTDYPNLVRLNPNVPWKTRGNGALCLRIRCKQELVEEIKEIVIEAVEENADLSYEGTDPGVVFLFNHVPKQVAAFAKRAIQGVVKMKEALRLVDKFEAEAVGFKKGRGIIGGLAAIGENLEGDHTYELITYRTLENRGTPRRIEQSSVVEMNEKTSPLTFNNIDTDTSRILITPRGPDPILYGIRGENPNAVRRAHEIVHSEEPIERWIIFRTNHGTDAHLRMVSSISEVKPFNPVVVRGVVAEDPKIITGGHVIFMIRDKTGEVDCAAYKPTGELQAAARKIVEGDFVEACGGVRPASSTHPITINLEKLRILKLAPKTFLFNPNCPRCGKRTKSMGSKKGFRCEKCGFRSTKLEKVAVEYKRDLEEGIYVTSPRSQRHLTKPLCRYGREKSNMSKRMIEIGTFHNL
jgi:tRNA(Ile2)-agmatinylcytidine synthase